MDGGGVGVNMDCCCIGTTRCRLWHRSVLMLRNELASFTVPQRRASYPLQMSIPGAWSPTFVSPDSFHHIRKDRSSGTCLPRLLWYLCHIHRICFIPSFPAFPFLLLLDSRHVTGLKSTARAAARAATSLHSTIRTCCDSPPVCTRSRTVSLSTSNHIQPPLPNLRTSAAHHSPPHDPAYPSTLSFISMHT